MGESDPGTLMGILREWKNTGNRPESEENWYDLILFEMIWFDMIRFYMICNDIYIYIYAYIYIYIQHIYIYIYM
mgnify:CR=1 FL=1